MNAESLSLLRRTVTAHLSDDENALYLRACEQTGLDPFGRFLYVARDRGHFRIESTIDGFRLTAERTGKYTGQIGPHWCGSDGNWKSIWTSKEPPVAARVGILRSDFQKPVWGKALYSEFVQMENGKPGEFWARMAANQLAKCAEALGFRKAFPERFSGLYTSDEMAQAGQMAGAGKAAAGFDAISNTGILNPADARKTNSGSSVALHVIPPTTPPQPRQQCFDDSTAGVDPEHGGVVPPYGPAVPLPLQPFVDAGMNRKHIQAAFGFLQGELERAHGPEGTAIFRRLWTQLPRSFRTKEEARIKTIACWCQMWAEVERAQEAA
jgi:phage recombination protein Bet